MFCVFPLCYPVIRSMGGILSLLYVTFFIMYGYGFLSRGLYRSAWNFAWWFGHISDRSCAILGLIAPGMAEFWPSTGAIWRDMLLSEALVLFGCHCKSAVNCLERLVSEMTYYVSSGTLNPTHWLTDWIIIGTGMPLSVYMMKSVMMMRSGRRVVCVVIRWRRGLPRPGVAAAFTLYWPAGVTQWSWSWLPRQWCWRRDKCSAASFTHQ